MGRAALTLRWTGIGVVLAAVAIGTAAIALDAPPREAVPRWLALLGASSLALGLAGLAAARLPGRQLAVAAVAGAALLRFAVLSAPVSLSDDVHRYVWDGALTIHGRSPYAHRPSDVVGAAPGLDAARLARLNSPRYFTVYPPLAQLAFAAAASAEPRVDGALALRALFGAFDLITVVALLALLDRLGRARAWALAYAWNPLVYWELVAGGHTEALLVPLLVLAALAAIDARPGRAGALLGLAASAKLTALVVLPLFVVHLAARRGLGRALGAAGLALAVLAAGFLPFASAALIPNVRESLALFGGRFSFNAPLYYALRDGMGYVEGLRPPVDPVLVPALAAATLASLALVVFVQDGTRQRFVAGLALGLLALLLFARVVHPWYLAPALAFGVAARSPSILLASLLLPLSYLRYHPFGREEPWVLVVEFVPILAVLLVEIGLRITAPDALPLPRGRRSAP